MKKTIILSGIIASLGIQLSVLQADPPELKELTVDWGKTADRIWVGERLWANRLQDWQVKDGRLECNVDKGMDMRTVHLLTARLARKTGEFDLSVRTGCATGPLGDDAETGFLLGAGRGVMDYRGAAIIHWPGNGAGIFAGIDAAGNMFIKDLEPNSGLSRLKPETDEETPKHKALPPKDTVLRLAARPLPNSDQMALRLSAHEPETLRELAHIESPFPAERLVGNLGLVCVPGRDAVNFWFRDWQIKGSKIAWHAADTFGPVACTQYTLSENTLKLTAQFLPISKKEPKTAQLQIRDGKRWKKIAAAKIIKPAYTATFKVENWQSAKDHAFRVAWNGFAWSGTVKHDPVEKEVITLAAFTGNHNNSHRLSGAKWGGGTTPLRDWTKGLWFPHQDLVDRVEMHDPDVLFFSGDQVYEGSSPTPRDREHLALDYLYKWYFFCWAYQDLMRDRPTLTIPDDHDVYQGNLWGGGGRKASKQEHGGYTNPAWFAKMVERTQTSHLPDPYNTRPIAQGITTYYTAMNYGRIGFAVLEDRKFKSGCRDITTNQRYPLDKTGFVLLGKKQLEFLEEWAGDWAGQDLKAVLSQTVFAQANTHSGPKLGRIHTDYDTNGWPRKGRERAVRAIRKAFAVHVAGDQHLATLLKHGLEEYADSFWSFCVPSIANFWPRAWAPKTKTYVLPEQQDYHGDHLDGFGNKITMYAATNPGRPSGHEPAELHDRMAGYGIIHFRKPSQEITFECWPRYAVPGKDKPYPGWPRTVKLGENYSRKPAAYLPTITVEGLASYVVRVIGRKDKQLVYARRFMQSECKLGVFEEGDYIVELGEPGTQSWRKLALSTAGKEEVGVKF